MKYYVYQLRREDSIFPFYIGKGCGDRLNTHFSPSYLKQRNIKATTIRKAIKGGVRVVAEKIYENLTESSAHFYESFLIKVYGKKKDGTGILANMTDGGEGVSGLKQSAETKQKISKVLTGRKVENRKSSKQSESHRQAISKSLKGKLPINLACGLFSFKGREHTEETKKRVSESCCNKPKFKCKYCEAEMHAAHIARYHNEKCKHKLNLPH